MHSNVWIFDSYRTNRTCLVKNHWLKNNCILSGSVIVWQHLCIQEATGAMQHAISSSVDSSSHTFRMDGGIKWCSVFQLTVCERKLSCKWFKCISKCFWQSTRLPVIMHFSTMGWPVNYTKPWNLSRYAIPPVFISGFI